MEGIGLIAALIGLLAALYACIVYYLRKRKERKKFERRLKSLPVLLDSDSSLDSVIENYESLPGIIYASLEKQLPLLPGNEEEADPWELLNRLESFNSQEALSVEEFFIRIVPVEKLITFLKLNFEERISGITRFLNSFVKKNPSICRRRMNLYFLLFLFQ